MPHQCTDCGRTFDDGSKEMLSGCPNCGGNKFQFRPDAATRRDAGAGAAGGSSGPAGVSDGAATSDDDILVADEEPPDPPAESGAEPPEPAVDGAVARTVGKAATTVRDLVGSDDPRRGAPAEVGAPSPAGGTTSADAAGPDDESSRTGVADTTDRHRDREAAARTRDSSTHDSSTREDTAQASARSAVVSPGELPETEPEGAATGPAPSATPARLEGDGGEDYEEPADRPDLADLRAELNEQFESIKVLEPGQYELNLMELYDREEYIIALQEDGKYTIQVPEGYGDG